MADVDAEQVGPQLTKEALITEEEEPAREALLYLGGLSTQTERKTITGVVARLEDAFDKADRTRATWRVHWSDTAVRRSEPSDPTKALATIYRKEAEADVPVIDVFQYDWQKKLLADWEERNLFFRTAYVLLTLLKLWEYPAKFRAAAKTTRGTAQLVVALVMLALMAFYAGSLIYAAVQTADQIWESATDKKTAPATTTTTTASVPAEPASPEGNGSDKERGASNWQRFVILGGVGIALLKRQGDRLRSSGGALTAADHYVRLGGKRQEMVGEMEKLCEDLSHTGRYPTVRVIGYSFGAIVAVDALFPTTGPPSGSFSAVKGLTTIGAPYDFVKAVRSGWRRGRHAGSNPPRWINVYAPTDVLGSNFRDDSSDGPATRGIAAATPLHANPKSPDAGEIMPVQNIKWDLGVELTLLNLLVLTGFTNHGRYWGDDDKVDSNVFDALVGPMYAGTPIVRVESAFRISD